MATIGSSWWRCGELERWDSTCDGRECVNWHLCSQNHGSEAVGECKLYSCPQCVVVLEASRPVVEGGEYWMMQLGSCNG